MQHALLNNYVPLSAKQQGLFVDSTGRKKWAFSVECWCPPQDLKFGHFTSLFRKRCQTNMSFCRTSQNCTINCPVYTNKTTVFWPSRCLSCRLRLNSVKNFLFAKTKTTRFTTNLQWPILRETANETPLGYNVTSSWMSNTNFRKALILTNSTTNLKREESNSNDFLRTGQNKQK